MKFLKRHEVYSPADFCWLRVTYHTETRVITIGREDQKPIEICRGDAHQIDELCALLLHLRNTHFSNEDARDDSESK